MKDSIAIIRKIDNKICVVQGFAICYEMEKNGSYIEFEVRNLYDDEISDYVSLDKLINKYQIEPQAFVEMLWLLDDWVGKKVKGGTI